MNNEQFNTEDNKSHMKAKLLKVLIRIWIKHSLTLLHPNTKKNTCKIKLINMIMEWIDFASFISEGVNDMIIVVFWTIT